MPTGVAPSVFHAPRVPEEVALFMVENNLDVASGNALKSMLAWQQQDSIIILLLLMILLLLLLIIMIMIMIVILINIIIIITITNANTDTNIHINDASVAAAGFGCCYRYCCCYG